ncbi:60S ribosomal protein L44 [Cryptococcus gattii E566]|nr:60S ribosomal protein L44 [Cryptococcus gattii E566]
MLITTFSLQTGPDEPTARVRLARSTPPTRLPSTRRARTLFPPKESDDTTESNPVTVVRPSLSSTRRLRPPRRLSSVSSAPSARPSTNSPSSDASTSSSVVTRSRGVPPFPSKQGLYVGAGFLLHARRIFGRLVDAWFGSGYLGMRDV